MKTSENLFYVSAIERLLDSSIDQVGLSLYKKANVDECLKSVLRNLSNILNTRSQTHADVYDMNELTVLDFGMPDFSCYSPENLEHKALLAKRIKKAINAFEPRLKDLSIDFEFDMPDEKSLVFLIKAYLKIDLYKYQVSFISKKEYSEGNWNIYETA